MAKSYVVYQGGASVYSFPFDYLSKQFIKVRTIATDGAVTDLTYGSGYTVVDKSVHLTTAVPATSRIRIFRKTDTNPITVFNDASILRAKDLNAFDVQLLHLSEEAQDSVEDAGIALDDSDGKYNAKMKVIKNVADGTEAHDVVNRGQLNAIAGSASAAASSAASALRYRNETQGFRNEAENFKKQAAVSATSSANSATASETSKQASEAARDTANQIKTDTQGLKNDVIALKADNVKLNADTKVLHDDTKVMHDEVASATPSRCLPLAGGTMTGNILIDDSAEHHVEGKSNHIGFYWNGHNFGAFDWNPQIPRGIWGYNGDNKLFTLNANGGVNVDTVLNLNGGGYFSTGSFTFNDDTETKIVGKTSQVGISFNSGKAFGIHDWKQNASLINWDGTTLKVGPTKSLTLNASYQGTIGVVQHSTEAPGLSYINGYGAQGYHRVQNGTHFFYNAGGSVRGNLAAAMLDLSDGTMGVYASVDSTNNILQFWDITHNRQADLRARQLWLNSPTGGDNLIFPGGVDTDAPFTNNSANLIIQAWQTLGFRSRLDGTIKAFINCRNGNFVTKGSVESHGLIVNGKDINTMLRAAAGQNTPTRTFHSILNKRALTPTTNVATGVTTYSTPNNNIPVTEDWTGYDTIIFVMSNGDRSFVGYRTITGIELNYALNNYQEFYMQTVGSQEWIRINAAVQIGTNASYQKSGPTVFHYAHISGHIVDILVSRVVVV